MWPISHHHDGPDHLRPCVNAKPCTSSDPRPPQASLSVKPPKGKIGWVCRDAAKVNRS